MIAELEQRKALLLSLSPEGIYKSVLARTGDAELAEKAKTEARVQAKLINLKNNPGPVG